MQYARLTQVTHIGDLCHARGPGLPRSTQILTDGYALCRVEQDVASLCVTRGPPCVSVYRAAASSETPVSHASTHATERCSESLCAG